jgi:2-hydroxychromene-2-carboxylate isomerase
MKKDYAARDWARLARLRGVAFRLPPHHPSIALPATRAFYFLDAPEPARAVRFAKAVFAAYYRGVLDTANRKRWRASARRWEPTRTSC